MNLNSLIQLAILWCQGDLTDKAEAFFMQLNPPGQNQESISANDKDWDMVFDTMVYIATQWTQDNATVYGKTHNFKQEVPQKYVEATTRRAIKAFRLSEEEDKVEHTGFLMLLFGYESRLSRDDYLNQIVRPDCNWIFTPEGIRHRITHFFEDHFLD